MNDFTYAWLIIASITLLMFLVQTAVQTENPEGPTFLNGTNPISRYYNSQGLDDSHPNSGLPGASSGGSQSDYTDEYRVTQSWIGSIAGNNFIGDTLDMPYNMLKSMSLPDTVCNAFGAFWWGLMILMTVMMILGKEI